MDKHEKNLLIAIAAVAVPSFALSIKQHRQIKASQHRAQIFEDRANTRAVLTAAARVMKKAERSPYASSEDMKTDFEFEKIAILYER